ncbi:hypothetical protein B11476_01230 [Campylobacter coli]|nr:hypothetical protein B11476_01230 [Campylobacter coli]
MNHLFLHELEYNKNYMKIITYLLNFIKMQNKDTKLQYKIEILYRFLKKDIGFYIYLLQLFNFY